MKRLLLALMCAAPWRREYPWRRSRHPFPRRPRRWWSWPFAPVWAVIWRTVPIRTTITTALRAVPMLLTTTTARWAVPTLSIPTADGIGRPIPRLSRSSGPAWAVTWRTVPIRTTITTALRAVPMPPTTITVRWAVPIPPIPTAVSAGRMGRRRSSRPVTAVWATVTTAAAVVITEDGVIKKKERADLLTGPLFFYLIFRAYR